MGKVVIVFTRIFFVILTCWTRKLFIFQRRLFLYLIHSFYDYWVPAKLELMSWKFYLFLWMNRTVTFCYDLLKIFKEDCFPLGVSLSRRVDRTNKVYCYIAYFSFLWIILKKYNNFVVWDWEVYTHNHTYTAILLHTKLYAHSHTYTVIHMSRTF